MDQLSKAFYELKFKNYMYEKTGNEFEDFFARIMMAKHKVDFIPCRAWGSDGDRKNDGYLVSMRHLFAVNGPETLNQSRMIEKIDTDFKGALPHWDFDKWSFVHNQEALPPKIVEKILELANEYRGRIAVNQWGPSKLKCLIFELADDLINEILGPIPSIREYAQLGFEDIQPIINAISRKPTPSEGDFIPVPENKLFINGFSDAIIGVIKMGLTRASLVEQYLNMQPNISLGDEIASTLSFEYIRMRDEMRLHPDAIYNGLFSFVCDGAKKDDVRYQVAVHTILAFFFEQCTIFERIKNRNT